MTTTPEELDSIADHLTDSRFFASMDFGVAAKKIAQAAADLRELTKERDLAKDACWALIASYRKSKEAGDGGSVDWDDINWAWELACHAYGLDPKEEGA